MKQNLDTVFQWESLLFQFLFKSWKNPLQIVCSDEVIVKCAAVIFSLGALRSYLLRYDFKLQLDIWFFHIWRQRYLTFSHPLLNHVLKILHDLIISLSFGVIFFNCVHFNKFQVRHWSDLVHFNLNNFLFQNLYPTFKKWAVHCSRLVLSTLSADVEAKLSLKLFKGRLQLCYTFP